LRAMILPPGKHKVEFFFRPKGYYVGDKIDLASSVILLLLVIGGVVWEVRGRMKDEG